MRRRGEFAIESVLPAAPAAVWDRAMSAEGINHELGPAMRMTVPREAGDLDLRKLEPGHLGRSWILLFGLIPFDYDDIGLARIEPGRGFLERSTMLSQRLWEHERRLEPEGEGTRISDRLAWELRLPLPGRLLRPLIAATFRHRHRRPQQHFNAVVPG